MNSSLQRRSNLFAYYKPGFDALPSDAGNQHPLFPFRLRRPVAHNEITERCDRSRASPIKLYGSAANVGLEQTENEILPFRRWE